MAETPLNPTTQTNAAGRTTNEVTPNKVTPGGYLCYLNGWLVPIVSAQITYGTKQIPQASITFFFSRHLHRLGAEDRMEVVLFYLDTYNTRQGDSHKAHYRLLFEGEIAGWRYSSNGEQRTIIADAIADISMLANIYYGTINNIERAADSATSTDPNSASTPGIYMQASLLTEGLLVKPSQADGVADGDKIKYPYQLLQNVLMGLTGSKNQKGDEIAAQRRYAAVNFFSRWARKRNFVNRFVALPNFDEPKKNQKDGEVFPVLQGLQDANILTALQQDINQNQAKAHLYDVVTTLFERMFYELAMLPTAPILTAEVRTGKITGVPTQPDRKATQPTSLRLANYFAKPKMFFSIPPAFNAVYPSMIRTLSHEERFWQQPTRIYVNDEITQSLLTGTPGDLNTIISRVMAVGYPREADEALNAAYHRVNLAGDDSDIQKAMASMKVGKNTLLWKEEFYRGPALVQGLAPDVYGMYVRSNITRRNDSDTAQQATHDALSVFAENEYYIRRYNKRAGQVDMVFNPYLVPGYPTVVLDRVGGFHTVGYLDQVSHVLTPQGMYTSMTYTGGRTVDEWVETIRNDSRELGQTLHSAPRDPVDEVRNVTQVLAAASDHYKKLFFRGQLPSATGGYQRSVAFDVTEVLVWKKGAVDHGAPTDSGSSEDLRAAERRKHKKKVVTPRDDIYTDAIPPDAVPHPRTPYEQVFQNTSVAMKVVARPICTLEEYIAFRNNPLNVWKDGFIDSTALKNWATREDSTFYAAAATPSGAKARGKTKWKRLARRDQNPGAVVYDRIYQLDNTQASTETIQAVAPFTRAGRIDGSTQPALNFNTPDKLKAIPNNRHQTVRNWDTIIEAYIKEVNDPWAEAPEGD